MSFEQADTSVTHRLRTFARDRGPVWVVRSCIGWLVGWVLGRFSLARPAGRTFLWDGRAVPYFRDRYHYTWLNERAVEVALALEVLDAHAGGEVLEIGNVLGHYRPVTHLVVDKYESAPGVVNADVADLDTPQRFDLVLAVSTLEHVGLDEEVQDPVKAKGAIDRLKSLLEPGGLLWVTLPVGYHPDLDRQLRDGEIEFTRMRALRRDDWVNRWREVAVDDVWSAGYDRLLYTAHGVVVAEYTAPR